MQRNIFAYTAPGADFPEYVSINERNGKIVLTARDRGAANLADVELPREKIADLIQSLLTLPPVQEVAEAKPLVLYFATEADREECIAAIQEVKPNMRAVRV